MQECMQYLSVLKVKPTHQILIQVFNTCSLILELKITLLAEYDHNFINIERMNSFMIIKNFL